MPVSYKEFAAQIKDKYPEYSEVDDLELSNKIIEKYPEYKEQVSFDNGVKFDDYSKQLGAAPVQPKVNTSMYFTPELEAQAKGEIKKPKSPMPNFFTKDTDIAGKIAGKYDQYYTQPTAEQVGQAEKYVKSSVEQQDIIDREKVEKKSYGGRLIDDLGEGMLSTASSLIGGTLNVVDRLKPENILAEIALRSSAGKEGYKASEELRKKRGDIVKEAADWLLLGAKDVEAKSNTTFEGKSGSDLWKEGKYGSSVMEYLLGGAKSFPTSVAAFTPIGLGVIGAGSFDQKYNEVSSTTDSNMLVSAINAGGTAAFELLTEKIGAGIEKGILKKLAKETGRDVAERSVKSIFYEWLKSTGMQTGTEALEEGVNAFAANVLDIATGVKKVGSVGEAVSESFKGVLDAALYGAGGGTFGGGAMGGPIAGINAAQLQSDKKQYQNNFQSADNNLTTLLTKNGFTAEDVDDIKNSLLQATPENRNSVVVAISQAIDGAITKTDGKVSFNPEVSKVFTNFLLSSDRLQSVNTKYNQAMEAERAETLRLEQEQQSIAAEKQAAADQLQSLASPDGMIRTVKMMDGTEMVIRGENIVFDPETGRLDRKNSSEMLYYTDENGEAQVLNPKTVDSILSEKPIEQAAFEADQQIDQEISDQEIDEFLPLQPETYQDAQGTVQVQYNPETMEIEAVLIDEASGTPISEPYAIDKATYSQMSGKPMPEAIKTTANEPVNESGAPVVSGDMTENAPEAAPKYPVNKKGEIDFDAMTVAQTYQYMVDNYGQEEAVKGLTMQENSIQGLISKNITALRKVNEALYGQLRNAPTIQEQLKIREKNKAAVTKLTDERTALDAQLAEIRALMPQVEQAPAQPEVKPVTSSNVRPEEQFRREQEAKAVSSEQLAVSSEETEPVQVEAEQQPVIEVREKEKNQNIINPWQKRLNNLGDAQTLEDVVLRRIAGGAKFVWNAKAPHKGLAQELGFSNKPGEREARKNMIDDKNGITPQEFTHAIYESGDIDFMGEVEYHDIYNAVIDTLLQVNSATAAMEMAERLRDSREFSMNEQAEWNSITPEEANYLESIPDDILESYLGITNFTPEQLDIIQNLQNEYYGTDTTTTEASAVDSTQGIESETAAAGTTKGIIKNWDTVTYKGKQYTVNGIYAGNKEVDLEDENGNLIHEEVPVSELNQSDNKATKAEKERARQEERKQRILSEGTDFDEPFGLIPVSEIKSAADIQANIEKIIATLKENEGNKKFDSFEGFAYGGKYAKNAGEQIRGYFMSIDVLPLDIRKEFAESIGITTKDEIVSWGEKKYNELNQSEQPAENQSSGNKLPEQAERPSAEYGIDLFSHYNTNHGATNTVYYNDKTGKFIEVENYVRGKETEISLEQAARLKFATEFRGATQRELNERYTKFEKDKFEKQIADLAGIKNTVPEQARPTINFNNWKWEKASTNAIVIRPNTVGKPFTDEQFNTIMEWGEKNNFTPIRNSRNTRIEFVVDKLDNALIDYLDSVSVKAINDKKAADEKAKKEEAEKAKKEELRNTVNSNPSTSWINREFGEDAMNDYNKNALAKFLNGETKKFEGQVNNKWVDAITRLNALTEDGKGVDFDKLKKAYEQAEAKPEVKNESEINGIKYTVDSREKNKIIINAKGKQYMINRFGVVAAVRENGFDVFDKITGTLSGDADFASKLAEQLGVPSKVDSKMDLVYDWSEPKPTKPTPEPAKPKETAKEEKQTSPELELVTVSTEFAAAKAKYDKAYNKYLDLKKKLEKDPAFGMGGQKDIFDNVSGADNLFGNDGQKQAVEAVKAAKKAADDLKPAVDELQAKADKLREAVTNKILKQQGMKFEEEVSETIETIYEQSKPKIAIVNDKNTTKLQAYEIGHEIGMQIKNAGLSKDARTFIADKKDITNVTNVLPYMDGLYDGFRDKTDNKPQYETKEPEGFRKNFDNEFGSFTSVFAYVNPNNPKEFMVQTTVRKANADGTISMQKHEKWMPIEKYDDFVADLNKRTETKEQQQGEFKYRLLFRPLSIGTHPKEGFVKHEEDGTKYGQLTYNRKLSKEEVKQFELEPVVNTDIYDGKDIVYMEDGADKYLATVSFTEYRGRKFAQIAKRDLEGTTYETETLTIPEFENKIESGEYKLVDEQAPQAEQPLSVEEQEIVDTDSKIQNIVEQPKITATDEKIEDVGQKIGGAKKDLFQEYAKKLLSVTDQDIARLPLSKSFPRPNFAQLIEGGKMTQETAIFLNYFYDNIPSKPQKSYKVERWVKTVREALDTFNAVLESKPTRDLMQEYIDMLNTNIVGQRKAFNAEVYRAVRKAINFPNNDVNVGNLTILRSQTGENAYVYSVGNPIGNRVKLTGRFNTMEEAAAKLIEMAKETAGKPKQVEFSVYSSRSSGDFYITPKGKGEIVLQNGFKTSKEAFEYINENREALTDRFNAMKEIPSERRMSNKERVGFDYRQGKNVTAEDFGKEFGFRGVEFGNWVNQEERQAHINEAYDALMDLASVIGVTPRALSLNGELGFAFGSRGGGKYAAHYETDKVVINLTKTKGAGTLAHEWFHALDNYLLRAVGNRTSYATDGPGFNKEGKPALRPELNDAFRNLMKVIRKSGFYTRSAKLDKVKGSKYWGTSIELGARGFEDFVMNKLAKSNIQNDYLVNFKSLAEFIDRVNGDISEITSKYPYPTMEESEAISEAYQNLFDTIQEDDNGVLFQIKSKRAKVSDIGFYSTIEKALNSINQEKGTKEQFKQMLLKNGAKQAEMDWMGFDELPDKLTKADIQNWIDENRIEVEEVVKGSKKDWVEKKDTWTRINGKNKVKIVKVSDNQFVGTANNFSQNFNTLEAAQNYYDGVQGYATETKFSQYVLPGGENYKELLLTMPVENGKGKFIVSESPRKGKYHVIDTDTRLPLGGVEFDSKEAAQRIADNQNHSFSTRPEHFKSSHFDEPNILAHVRFNERTVNGERVLFIEEIQSDWAQKGKKEGFKIGNKENVVEDNTVFWVYNTDGKFGFVPKTEAKTSKDALEYSKLHPEIFINETGKEGVPDMPFRKTDQWVNLSIRRMMHYAAENGFDRIAWTTGEQQSDRYDLAKQVDSIYYHKNENGTFAVSAIIGGRGNMLGENLNEKELENNVGKEIANKIINGDGVSTEVQGKYGRMNKLSGIDLKVGGEGMKAFYDAIVPSAMSKLGKPFGAKLEPISLNLKTNDIVDSVFERPNGTWGIAYEQGKFYDTKEQALAALESIRPSGTTQQSIPVTGSMKETAMAGLPLFQIKTKDFDNAKTTKEKYEAAVEITKGLDDVFGYETTTVKDDDAMIEIMPEYEEDIRNYYVGGVLYNGKVILNAQTHDSGKEVIESYFHEYAHKINRTLFTYDELISFYRSLPEADKVLPEGYENIQEYKLADEVIAHAVQNLVEKHGYENFINGNVDLSLYSKPLQNILKQIIDYYGKSKLSRSYSRGKNDSNTSKETNGNNERNGQNGLQNTVGQTGQIQTDIQGAVPGRSEGILQGKILVDGVERPTTNSTGKPIHSTVEGIRNFWRWFGGKPDSDFTEIQNELLTTSLFKSEIELADSIISSLKSHSGNISYFRQSRAVVDHILNNTIESDMRMLLTNVHGIISNDPQVLNSIVEFIPVDVMNNLRSEKITPDMILNDKSMLQNLLSIEGKSTIPFGRDIANSIIRCVAFSTTKPTSTLRFRESYTNSTVLTGKSNPILSTLPTTKELFTAVYPVVMDIKLDTAPRTLDTNHNKLFNFITKISVLGIESKLTAEKVINNIEKTTSKVVDAKGRPLVVYHGTGADFDKFNSKVFPTAGYFSKTPDIANSVAHAKTEYYNENGSVYPVYLSFKNPLNLNSIDGQTKYSVDELSKDFPIELNEEIKKELSKTYKNPNPLWSYLADKKLIDYIKSNGYDGVLYKEGEVDTELNKYLEVPVNNTESLIAFYPTQIKSATGNFGSFDPSNADIRYQILGEKGARNLDAAEEATIRLDNLAVAKEMEATKNPQEIRLATGWEKGVDGLWRYEVPDIEPKLNIFNLESERDSERNRIVSMGHGSISEMRKNSDPLVDKYNSIENEINRLNEGVSLSEYISDDIIKAYPELANVKVITNAFISDGTLGSFDTNKTTGEKTINIAGSYAVKTQEQFKSTLIHEIQHAIQDIEGFAKGGSPAAFSQSRDNINRLFKDIENAFDKLGYEDWLINGGKVDTTPNRNFNGMYSFAETQSKSVRDRMVSKLDEANKVINENKSIFGNNNIYDNIKDEELYRKLSGEVEARNASARMNFTADERRQRLLSETADVAPEDQIVLMDAVGVSESRPMPKPTPPTFTSRDTFLDRLQANKKYNEELKKWQSENIQDIAAQVGETNEVNAKLAELNKAVDATRAKLWEGWADSQKPVKKWQNYLKENGIDFLDTDDYYLRFTMVPSRVEYRFAEFQKNNIDTFVKTIKKFDNKGISYDDLATYAKLKHADEYTEHIAARKKVQVTPDTDFAGKKAIEERIGMTAEEYISEIEALAGQDLIDTFWKQTKAINEFSLDEEVRSGIRSAESEREIKEMFQWYVPLKNHYDLTAEDAFDYSKERGTFFVSAVKKGKGRLSESGDPFSVMASTVRSTIGASEDNVLKQTLLRLAEKDNTGSTSVSKAWFVKVDEEVDDEGNVRPIFELAPEVPYTDTDTQETYTAKVAAHDEKMKQLAEAGEAYQGKVPKLKLGVWIKPTNVREHEVHVMRNGETYLIRFNTSPRIPQAINKVNYRYYDGAIGRTFEEIGKVTRFMAAAKTMFRPTFIFITNPLRDIHAGLNIAFIDEGVTFAANVAGYIPRAAYTLGRRMTGKIDLNDKYDRALNTYLLNGGKTGISKILELKQVERDLKDRMDKKIHPWDSFKKAYQSISEITENQVRLAVYFAAIDKGYSALKATSMAKEATINFDRKGNGRNALREIKSLYAFTNVGFQALDNIYTKSTKDSASQKRFIASVAMNAFAGGVLVSLISSAIAAAFGADDDEWLEDFSKLSSFERNANFLVWTPNGVLKYPLGQEFRIYHALGMDFMMLAHGKTTATETAINMVKGLSSLVPYNPIEATAMGSWGSAMPDVVSPLTELATNRDWMGSRIYKENQSPEQAGYTKVRTNKRGEPYATETMMLFAKALDKGTGGDGAKKGWLSPNPDIVEHLLGGYLAGLYTQSMTMAEAGVKADPSEFIPSAIWKSGDDIKQRNSGLNEKYFEAKDEVKEMTRLIKVYNQQLERNENEYKTNLINEETYNGTKKSLIEKIEYIQNDEYYKNNAIIKQIVQTEDELQGTPEKQQRQTETQISALKTSIVDKKPIQGYLGAKTQYDALLDKVNDYRKQKVITGKENPQLEEAYGRLYTPVGRMKSIHSYVSAIEKQIKENNENVELTPEEKKQQNAELEAAATELMNQIIQQP